MATLESLNFDNSYIQLPEHFYQETAPTELKNPHLIAFNAEVAQLLDLDPCHANPSALAQYLGGEKLFPGSEPLAMKYTGHQFGVYNPELGDGRGLLLGEVVNQNNERWDLHLKGAGKTAFSRFGDGRAVLRSSIREYMIGEAMHYLGIPSTRALAIAGSEELAMRDGMMEPCAAVLRVTKSHIRFGHFEYFYHTRQHDDLKRLADYCLTRYFPEFLASEKPVLRMYEEVVRRSARLVAQWQAYGFVHGVLNTDNMSIIGETFDYGPYSFLDAYKPATVSNHNDHQGRYAFYRQPEIIHWNLSCLGQALLPLIDREDVIAVLDSYPALFATKFQQIFRQRLGLTLQEAEDGTLIEELLKLCDAQQLDLNRFIRTLSHNDEQLMGEFLLSSSGNLSACQPWLDKFQQRLQLEETNLNPNERKAQMLKVNPKYILRNYMAEEAIRAATDGDFTVLHDLMLLLRNPMEEQPEFQKYSETPPDWAGGICLTCSS